MSGGEIDRWQAPGEGARGWCKPRAEWPAQPLRVTIAFEHGEAVALDGEAMAGHAMLARLNGLFAQYGVGRGLYTGDTTIGLKGRIIFEAPGLTALLTAHRALEEAVLSKQQNRFKPDVARKWVELVYEGFFHDPLKTDLEAFLASSQSTVNGEVVLETQRRHRQRGRDRVAAHPQRQGRDLRAGGRLGRGRGRGLHQAVRHEQHAVGRGQPQAMSRLTVTDDMLDVVSSTSKRWCRSTPATRRAQIGTGGIFDYLRAQLPGFRIDVTDHGDGAVSMLAVRGKPTRVFNVHLDTVPSSPAWTRRSAHAARDRRPRHRPGRLRHQGRRGGLAGRGRA